MHTRYIRNSDMLGRGVPGHGGNETRIENLVYCFEVEML
jgi:hypothetical protein